MSLSELGKRAGIDRTAIARAERRGYDPRASTVSAIAKGLGVPVCELFEETGHERSKRKTGKTVSAESAESSSATLKAALALRTGYAAAPGGSATSTRTATSIARRLGRRGSRSNLYQKRKNEVQERRFFPERIRRERKCSYRP